MNQLNALCRLVMAEREARNLLERIRLTRENFVSFLHIAGTSSNMKHLHEFIKDDLRKSAGKVLVHIDRADSEMADWLDEDLGPEAA